jgi:hypothetical protein
MSTLQPSLPKVQPEAKRVFYKLLISAGPGTPSIGHYKPYFVIDSLQNTMKAFRAKLEDYRTDARWPFAWSAVVQRLTVDVNDAFWYHTVYRWTCEDLVLRRKKFSWNECFLEEDVFLRWYFSGAGVRISS